VLRYLKHRLREHQMSGPHAEHCARGLRHDIAGNFVPAHSALARVGERHGGIEMCAGNRAECKNERNQRRARRQRIREKRDGDVAAAEALAHDARTNDSRQQQCRSEFLIERAG
jgi:hypothetical protein